MDRTLSSRQRDLLAFIEEAVNQEHRMPSYREMAKALKVSAVGTVQDHLRILIEKGYVEKNNKGLKLCGARQGPVLSVPIIGEVAAGSLQDAFEVALGAMAVSPEFLKRVAKPEEYFALRVSGESMIDAGILPKDYIVVQRGAKVKSGDIVVAALNGEATVKEIRMTEGRIDLIPKNAKMKPIPIAPNEDFRVLGKVVSVQRFF